MLSEELGERFLIKLGKIKRKVRSSVPETGLKDL
jgi:hypothetical protein